VLIGFVHTGKFRLHLLTMIMIISPFGELGLWAPSSGEQAVFKSTAHGFALIGFIHTDWVCSH
jgi:hypothetical protein